MPATYPLNRMTRAELANASLEYLTDRLSRLSIAATFEDFDADTIAAEVDATRAELDCRAAAQDRAIAAATLPAAVPTPAGVRELVEQLPAADRFAIAASVYNTTNDVIAAALGAQYMRERQNLADRLMALLRPFTHDYHEHDTPHRALLEALDDVHAYVVELHGVTTAHAELRGVCDADGQLVAGVES